MERFYRMRTSQAIVFIGFGCLMATGCSGPAVRVEHRFDNAVVLPDGVRAVGIGDFLVEGYSREAASEFVREALAENLPKAGYEPAGVESGTVVEGSLRIDVKDTEGVRTVRQGNPAGAMGERELAGFVRQAVVNCEFRVKAAGAGEPVTVELERAYDSTGDRRTRGELGLERGDEPGNAVAKDTIVKELIGECAEDFCGMLAPLLVKTEYVLRGSRNAEAQRGAKAAKRGDFAGAAGYYKQATEAEPNNGDLWFNLGVVTGAQGDFANAHSSFERAAELNGEKDTEAREALELAGKLMGKRPPRLSAAG